MPLLGIFGSNLRCLLAALFVLLPSGWFVIQYPEMPHFGAFHDDAVYWTTAQAIAQKGRYEVPYLPEQPAQVKYPPLYPMLLSAVWWMDGAFPQNLRLASALQWLFLALFLWMVWLTFRRFGFSRGWSYGMTLGIAAAPMTVVLGSALMTEVPFAAAVLAALLVVESEELTPARAFAAGVVCAAAFLLRTNGIVLGGTVVLLLLAGRRVKPALAFVTPVLLAFAGWQWWCASNAVSIVDDRTAYYASYPAFFAHTVNWMAAPEWWWRNASTVLESIGRLILFHPAPGLLLRAVYWVIAAAAISGAVALFRRGYRLHVLFAFAFTGVLIVWPYPPGERFVYPLFPLAVAGFVIRLQTIAGLARTSLCSPAAGDRVAGAVAIVLLTGLVAACISASGRALFSDVPQSFAGRAIQHQRMLRAYKWIREHMPENALVAAYDDGLLYLHTGRRGYTAPLMPDRCYDSVHEDDRSYCERLQVGWRRDGLTHVLVTEYDFHRDPVRLELGQFLQPSAGFESEYADSTARVYRIRAKLQTERSSVDIHAGSLARDR